jgi:D-ribose pyranase
MKKMGILNQEISEVVAGMGHQDMLVVGDAGLPIPAGARRIDLALCPGVPGFLQTVQTIAGELKVERILVARETFAVSPQIGAGIKEIFGETAVVEISHDELKALSAKSRAVVRTGEFTPYANIILVSGVVF